MQPRFQQIKTALLNAIEDGVICAGDKVPSENQLSEQHGVSRMTARRALTELVDEGVLIRSQGLGTYVSDLRPTSSMLAIRSIQDEVERRGHQYRNQVITLETQTATEQVALWLGIKPLLPVYFSQIVHFENDIAVQCENRWVNPMQVPDYLQQDFQQTTANEYLSQVAPLTEADHIVEAIIAPQEVCDLLSIATTQPCLKVTRRTYSAKGIVSYAQLIHPGDRYRLGGHLDF
ncbi:histidine utilization repressor [Alteromonas sp. ASW11-36]|uniref:Histidine utilization repressor n=1 Tax=Alteromonas arenosi TaxID=3055817 RepID=A0ABT7ST73_9ALTE|nr:histidine utilization repressor [Alteromonas sp. ASW11-36]MDM7859393.1 histidine utilization repressor [Alteromonas sp. ASW11-36]